MNFEDQDQGVGVCLGCPQQRNFVPESERLPKYGVIFGTCMLYICCMYTCRCTVIYALMKALGVIPLIA